MLGCERSEVMPVEDRNYTRPSYPRFSGVTFQAATMRQVDQLNRVE